MIMTRAFHFKRYEVNIGYEFVVLKKGLQNKLTGYLFNLFNILFPKLRLPIHKIRLGRVVVSQFNNDTTVD